VILMVDGGSRLAYKRPMPNERRFLLAPSFARLIRREQGSSDRIVEGHFPPQADRSQFVRVHSRGCELVLAAKGDDDAWTEERAEVPRPHAEALIDVAAGTVALDRTTIAAAREIHVDTFVAPTAGFSLLTIAFEEGEDPQRFYAPQWFGREVTADDAFRRAAIALEGPPASGEVPITDAGLDELLTLLERQSWRAHRPDRRTAVVAPVEAKAERAAAPKQEGGTTGGEEEEGPMLKLARALAPERHSTAH
jgi:CYTH domain-containing protein